VVGGGLWRDFMSGTTSSHCETNTLRKLSHYEENALHKSCRYKPSSFCKSTEGEIIDVFWNTPSDDALQDIDKVLSVYLDEMGVGISTATTAEWVYINDGDKESRTTEWDKLRVTYTELLERMHQQQKDTTRKWTKMRDKQSTEFDEKSCMIIHKEACMLLDWLQSIRGVVEFMWDEYQSKCGVSERIRKELTLLEKRVRRALRDSNMKSGRAN
jgi:hypothetical protein